MEKGGWQAAGLAFGLHRTNVTIALNPNSGGRMAWVKKALQGHEPVAARARAQQRQQQQEEEEQQEQRSSRLLVRRGPAGASPASASSRVPTLPPGVYTGIAGTPPVPAAGSPHYQHSVYPRLSIQSIAPHFMRLRRACSTAPLV